MNRRLLLFSALCLSLLILSFSKKSAEPGCLSAQVTLDKMHVLYIGVDNPLSVSVCGVAAENLVLSMNGGAISGARGRYKIHVSGGTEATLNVSVKKNGIAQPVGAYKFRIKRVPDPVIYVGSVKGDGFINRVQASYIKTVWVKLENFDFDASFSVLSFDLSFAEKGGYKTYSAKGPNVTPEMAEALKGIESGDRIWFENVVVKGPDGSVRKVPGVTVKVQ